MADTSVGTLRGLVESIERIQQALERYPALQPLVVEMLNGSTAPRPTIRGTTTRRKRKMSAAQIAANSRRMKKMWKERKRMGKNSLG